MRKSAAALLLLLVVVPAADARQRALRRGGGDSQWRAPQCTQITGLPWIRFIDSAGEVRSSIDPEVIWRQPVVTTEALAIGATPNVLWAFTSDGGIHQSSDAGCTWTERARVPEAVANDDRWRFEPRMFAAGPRVFLYQNDKMVRLTYGTIEARTLPENFVEIAAHPIDPSYLRAVAGSGAVYDSNDAGTTWYQRGNYHAQLKSAHIDPTDFDVILFGRTRGLSISTDGGKTVASVDPKHSMLEVWQIEHSPADPKIVWVDGYDFAGRTVRLLRSDDGGRTFKAEGRYNRVGWVAPSGLAAHPREPLTFAAQNNPGVRVIASDGQRGEWVYGNYKKAVWSPAGTLYVLHQVVELR